jgi:hypothetical protein
MSRNFLVFLKIFKENTPKITPILFLKLNRQSVKKFRAKMKNDQKYSFDKNHIYWKTALYRSRRKWCEICYFRTFFKKNSTVITPILLLELNRQSVKKLRAKMKNA